MKFISLKYKLFYFSIVISFLLTVFMSIIEINYDINNYKTTLHDQLMSFEKSNQKYMASEIWSMQYDSLQAFIDNKTAGKWITQVKIVDIRGDTVANAGEGLTKQSLQHVTDLTYFHNNKENSIGRVTFGGNFPGFVEILKERWGSIFLLNGFFVVVIFVVSYGLFYKNVLSRLLDIILFTNKNPIIGEQVSDIYPPTHKNSHDEIDQLIDSLNNRAARITKEFTKRLTAESDLENKNLQLSSEIEERHLLEKELRESEKKYRNFLESTSTIPWELDLRNGEFTYMGKQVESILGYPVDSWVNFNSWMDRLHPDDRNDAVNFCKTETKKGNDHDFTYRAIHKDGSYRWIRNIVSVVKDADGPKKLVGFMHDITSHMNLSREKDQLESQLRQAQKMETIGTLAGGIAHDFNNLLSVILGYSEMAKEQLGASDPIRKDLSQVLTAVRRATDLVKQILTFSRQGEEDLRPVNVQSIIQEVLKLLRSSLPTTIYLKETIYTDCGMIWADPTQIHQVLMNLCTNAKHAIGDELGTLSVSLSETRVTEAEIIDDCPQLLPGTYLKLEVTDTGCGMDVLTQAKIFDPFFTTKEKEKGTGLGLAVVHGIIKQHNGEIIVTSALQQGTTFHIYLPVIEDVKTQSELEIIEDIPRGNDERILFVDDEIVIAKMMRRTLKSIGYKVSIFTSSLEALDAYKQNPDGFDLIITDMTMPEMTGIDLARNVRALRPELPVILCTGFSESIDEEKAKAFGINQYIKKPVDNHTLAKAISEALKPS